MGLTYTIDEARNFILITGDYADAPEWHRLLTAVLADQRRKPGCVVLRDQRGGTKPVDASTVVAIMELVRRFWNQLAIRRAAIVMPRELDPPALVAHAIADAENMPIRAFTSYDAAVEWLIQGSETAIDHTSSAHRESR